MTIEILSPEKLIYKGRAESVQLPGKEGSFGILENHAPIIATLQAGQVRVVHEDEEKFFDITGGVVEVLQNRVIVLSD